jgi:hypothetical protein
MPFAVLLIARVVNVGEGAFGLVALLHNVISVLGVARVFQAVGDALLGPAFISSIFHFDHFRSPLLCLKVSVGIGPARIVRSAIVGPVT